MSDFSLIFLELENYVTMTDFQSMMKHSKRNDLCLLILVPANDAATKFCNQAKSSLICQIQIDSNRKNENGLIYTCIKQQQIAMKSKQETQNNNSMKTSLINSLRKLTIEEKDLIKQRQVKINNTLK